MPRVEEIEYAIGDHQALPVLAQTLAPGRQGILGEKFSRSHLSVPGLGLNGPDLRICLAHRLHKTSGRSSICSYISI